VLEALINDPDRRSRYGSAGRELAIERYSIDSVVEQTLGIYEKLTANARR
jgi:glycosyltransferase involved in cell wall biosynthesis